MRNKALAAIALQMILWHSTTNGSTMLHHGRGQGESRAHSQSQDLILFEQNQSSPEERTRTQFKIEGQEASVTSSDVIRLRYESDVKAGYSTGVADGNYDATDPRFGDYDPYDPMLDPD